MPTKTWAVGEEVLAADFNTYVQNQVVSTFSTTAARDTAIPAPTTGMTVHIAATNTLQTYSGTAWTNVGGGALGVLAFGQLTTTTGAVGTTDAVIPGLTLNVTHVGGRKVLVEGYAPTVVPTAAGFTELKIMAGATQLNYARTTTAAATSSGFLNPKIIYTPGAGAVAYTMRGQTNSGTSQFAASAIAPLWLAVTDLGF